jgi:predicted metal-binding membrane protein
MSSPRCAGPNATVRPSLARLLIANGWLLGALAVVFAACAAETFRLIHSGSCCCEMSAQIGLSEMCRVAPGESWLVRGGSFLWMWMVMMAAMMLPCLAPMLLVHRAATLEGSRVRRSILTMATSIGYFMVWGMLGLAVFAGGGAFSAFVDRGNQLATVLPLLAGAALLAAGAIQFTPWKACQLRCCRAATVNASDAARRAVPALMHGIRLGVRCCLCCSGFTACLLVLGMMNPAVMIVVAGGMIAERLAPRPMLVARLFGLVMGGYGLLTILQAIR